MSQSPKALQDTHLAMVWFIPALDKFPRNRRFTLGERIETGLLNVLGCLVEATYTPQMKLAKLREANLSLEVVRHLWRLSYELKVIGMKSYKHGMSLLLEIGKQIGGWIKSCRRDT